MIMTSMFPLEVGKSYTQRDFPGLPMRITCNGEHISDFGFLVIRESNETEYINFCKTEWPERVAKHSFGFIELCIYYYEIHMD